jgi:hypothetical protein
MKADHPTSSSRSSAMGTVEGPYCSRSAHDADRTSADDGHTRVGKRLVTCGNAETAGWGRVTTRGAGQALGSAGAQPAVGTVKSKNRGGSGSSRAARMAFCPGVVAERCAT